MFLIYKLFKAIGEDNLSYIKIMLEKNWIKSILDNDNVKSVFETYNFKDKFPIYKNIDDLLHLKCKDILLHLVVQRGLVYIADMLIKKYSSDVNAQDGNGYTPLHFAIQKNNKDIVEILINNGADVSVTNKYGRTPLHFAERVAEQEEYQYINKLLTCHWFYKNEIKVKYSTFLHIAVCEDYKEIAKNLIFYGGADINAQDGNGCTPLHVAIQKNNKDMVKLLINSGSDVNAQSNIDYSTPLHFAVFYGYLILVEILLNVGANINSIDIYGNTPLHYAAAKGYIDILSFLIKNNADLNVQNVYMYTALHYAVMSESIEAAIVLIKAKVDINLKDDIGTTALYHVLCNILDIVKKSLVGKSLNEDADEYKKYEKNIEAARILINHYLRLNLLIEVRKDTSVKRGSISVVEELYQYYYVVNYQKKINPHIKNILNITIAKFNSEEISIKDFIIKNIYLSKYSKNEDLKKFFTQDELFSEYVAVTSTDLMQYNNQLPNSALYSLKEVKNISYNNITKYI